MRKLYIYVILFMVALSACDQENKGPVIPGAKLDNVYFPEKALSGLEVGAENSSVFCPIARYLKEESGTSISVKMVLAPEDEGLFELKDSDFVFGEGEMEKNVEILVPDLSLLDPFKTYSITLELVGENALVFYNESELKVSKERIFSSIGVGTVTSEIFGGAWSVDVLGLVGDGQAIYKVDLYGDGYFVDIYVTGTDIDVASQPAWIHGDYGDIYVVGEGSVSGKDLSMVLYHYVPGLGGFGDFNEVLTLP